MDITSKQLNMQSPLENYCIQICHIIFVHWTMFFITLTEFYCVRKISDISSLYNRSKHPDLHFRTNLVCMAFLGIWVGNTLVLHPSVQFASTPIYQQNVNLFFNTPIYQQNMIVCCNLQLLSEGQGF